MVGSPRRAAALVVPLLLLAGCLSVDDVEDHGLLPVPDRSDLDGTVSVPMQGCLHGGAVALYDREWYGERGPPEPFTLRDVSAEVGDPRFGAQGPLDGEMTGHWHMTVMCAGASFDGTDLGAFGWGWVGIGITAPPWDDSGITRQYFAADLSFPAGAVFDALHDGGIGHLSRTLAARLEVLPGDILHQQLDDEVHGVYEVYGALGRQGVEEPTSVRLWALVPVGEAAAHDHGSGNGKEDGHGMRFRPVSLDLVVTGHEVGHLTTHDSSAWFTHTRTKHHEPLPWGAGNVAGVAWTGLDIEVRLGPQPDLEFRATWLH